MILRRAYRLYQGKANAQHWLTVRALSYQRQMKQTTLRRTSASPNCPIPWKYDINNERHHHDKSEGEQDCSSWYTCWRLLKVSCNSRLVKKKLVGKRTTARFRQIIDLLRHTPETLRLFVGPHLHGTSTNYILQVWSSWWDKSVILPACSDPTRKPHMLWWWISWASLFICFVNVLMISFAQGILFDSWDEVYVGAGHIQ